MRRFNHKSDESIKKTHQLRSMRGEVLKALPNGSVVVYVGYITSFFGLECKKVFSNRNHMEVIINGKQRRFSLVDLTCQQIKDAEEIASILLNEQK